MFFKGFKIEKKNIAGIEKVTDDIRKAINIQANKEFAELVSREAQNIIDDVALNVYNKPDIEIIDAAVNSVNAKINIAINRGFTTEYNLGAAIQIFYYDKYTYIELIACNENYFKCLKPIKDLIDYSVNDQITDDPIQSQRAAEWTKIIEKYKTISAMSIKLCPLAPFKKPDYKELYFDDVSKRAEIRARYRLTNNYLSMYSSGAEIPSHQLMNYMDLAMLKLTDVNSKAILEEYKNELMPILPNITESLVYHNIPDTSDSETT